MSNPSSEARHKQRPWLDLGPLLVFFVANWRFGIYVATGSTPTIRYTDFSGNVPTNVGGSKVDADYIGLNGNVSLVPSFTSRTPGAYDYHLLPSSPLIDIGDNANAAPFDFDGVPIPQDGNYSGPATTDMGAFEFPRDLDSDGTPDWLDPDDDNDGTLDVDDCSPERRGVSYPPGKVGNSVRFEKQGGGRVDSRRDIVVVGVEQCPADDQSADGRALQRLLPSGVRLLGSCLATEQEHRQRRRLEHPFHLVDDRQLQPGVGRRAAQRLADADGADQRVGPRVELRGAVDPGDR